MSTSWFAREPADQILVERLCETRVGDGGRQAERGELVGGLEAVGKPRAERQDGDGGTLAHDAAAADLERNADVGEFDADAFAARIAQRARPVIDDDGGRDHVAKLGLVGRGHDDEVRQAAEVGEIEGAGVGRTVGTDEAGAVEREADREFLDGDVVHDLVVGALQEGRIDRRERLVALGREAGREGDAVLLGDADIESAIGERLAEVVEAGARRALPR